MIHQPELVVGERLPGVVDRHGAGGLAAIGVALVHRDAAEVLRERFHRVDHRGWPVADAGVRPHRGDQQRKARASLLVADADVALVIKRHGSLSLYRVVLCERARLDEPREPLESSSRPECAAPRLCGYACTRSGAAGQGGHQPREERTSLSSTPLWSRRLYLLSWSRGNNSSPRLPCCPNPCLLPRRSACQPLSAGMPAMSAAIFPRLPGNGRPRA